MAEMESMTGEVTTRLGEKESVLPGAQPRFGGPIKIRFSHEYVRFALRLFGRFAEPIAQRSKKLKTSLEQAHMEYLPDAFLALSMLNAGLATLAAYLLLGAGVVGAYLLGLGLVSPPILLILAFVPWMIGASVYVALAVYPEHRADNRRRAIDREMPYAVNYISAMASAGVIPTALFRDLAREPIYGEVSREAAWMMRDIDLLGYDLIGAINRAIARSPSRRFQEFLQGAKTTILSGGNLKTYFPAKAEQYMNENQRAQKDFLDGLGILAESYVTVVIAGPLFMLVMLSIMMLVGKSTSSAEGFLFLLVFLMLPIAHVSFTWIINTMTPEV